MALSTSAQVRVHSRNGRTLASNVPSCWSNDSSWAFNACTWARRAVRSSIRAGGVRQHTDEPWLRCLRTLSGKGLDLVDLHYRDVVLPMEGRDFGDQFSDPGDQDAGHGVPLVAWTSGLAHIQS